MERAPDCLQRPLLTTLRAFLLGTLRCITYMRACICASALTAACTEQLPLPSLTDFDGALPGWIRHGRPSSSLDEGRKPEAKPPFNPHRKSGREARRATVSLAVLRSKVPSSIVARQRTHVAL